MLSRMHELFISMLLIFPRPMRLRSRRRIFASADIFRGTPPDATHAFLLSLQLLLSFLSHDALHAFAQPRTNSTTFDGLS